MYRVLDSSINRVSEGLRVIEDILRFKFSNFQFSKKIKELRHCVRDTLKSDDSKLLEFRDLKSDFGLEIDKELKILKSEDIPSVMVSNFKRAQEGLRTLEEVCSINGFFNESNTYKNIRYKIYSLEKQIIELISSRNFTLPDLYGITYLKDSAGRSNVEVVKQMIDAGIKLIQYREKDLTLLEKYYECIEIKELTKKNDVLFIINDNIDLALLVDADGVHIGQDDLPINEVRRLLGDKKIIGLSTHSPIQAKKAVLDGADYIGVGPIFSTKTKVNVCDPVGLEYLEWVKENIDIPFVTIGGIKEHNLEKVIDSGAACIALVSEITSSKCIKSKVNSIRSKIKEINKNEI